MALPKNLNVLKRKLNCSKGTQNKQDLEIIFLRKSPNYLSANIYIHLMQHRPTNEKKGNTA